MATLSTDTNKLRAISRRRALADALTAQSMNTQPLVHPLQGYAQLAQALAANAINKRAGSDEQEIAQRRAQALAEALQPRSDVTFGPEREPTGIQSFEQIQGGPAAIQPDFARQPRQLNVGPLRDPTTSEIVQGLPTDLGEGVLASVAQRQAMVNAGLTDAQLRGRNTLGPLMQKAADLRAMGFSAPVVRSLVGEAAGVRSVSGFMSGSTKPTTAISFGGRFFLEAPQTDENFLGIGTDVTGRFVPSRINIDATDASVFGDSLGEAQKIDIGYQQSIGLIDSIIDDVHTAGAEALNFTGTISTKINTLFTQTKALVKTLGAGGSNQGRAPALVNGRVTAEVGGKTVPESELFNPNLYRGYLQPFLSNTAFSQNAQDQQRIMTQAITLAYALARADDPGGRLSEKDVELQMRKLGLEQGDPRVTIAALAELREVVTRNTGIALNVMSGDNPYEFKPIAVSPRLQQIINQRTQADSISPVALPSGNLQEGDIQIGSDGFVWVVRGGQLVRTEQRVP